MTETSVLDLQEALDNLDGNRKIYDAVVGIFLQEREKYVAGILEAIEGEDWNKVVRGAHGLKSASMAIGGMRLSGAAATLEEKSNEDGVGGAINMCEIIAREIESLSAALAKEGFEV